MSPSVWKYHAEPLKKLLVHMLFEEETKLPVVYPAALQSATAHSVLVALSQLQVLPHEQYGRVSVPSEEMISPGPAVVVVVVVVDVVVVVVVVVIGVPPV